jgi:hypothetical protein
MDDYVSLKQMVQRMFHDHSHSLIVTMIIDFAIGGVETVRMTRPTMNEAAGDK